MTPGAGLRALVVIVAALSGGSGCSRLPDGADPPGDALAAWQAFERCEESRARLEACPQGTGARKRRRDDCRLSEHIARMHDRGYPRCPEPQQPRPSPG